jgi:hypothetical protein
MDETALQTGLLLDLAKQQHATTETALTRLTDHTRHLDDILRDGLRRALTGELATLEVELDEAIAALRAVHRAARWRTLWITPIFAIVGAAAGLLPVLALVPSRAEIAERQATVATLDARGGALDLKHCALAHRNPHLCVRIDKAAGGFGPEGDYYVVR